MTEPLALKIGDTVIYETVRMTIAHRVERVRENGKVVLRAKARPGTKAVTVKLANIGKGRDSGKTYYVEYWS